MQDENVFLGQSDLGTLEKLWGGGRGGGGEFSSCKNFSLYEFF